jgi:cytochrome c-type biogenesis protein CcmH
MPEALRKAVVVLLAALLGAAAAAKEALPEAADPALEARMTRITAELRCLVCQNQTIADSNAGLAVDLRRETREMLRQGKSDAEIIAYMTARYGDFVLYRPPLKSTTALLWFGPAAMLALGAAGLVLVLRRRTRLSAESFEADEEDAGAEAAAESAAVAAANRP